MSESNFYKYTDGIKVNVPEFIEPPNVDELSADKRYDLWKDNQKLIQREKLKAKASWFLTLLICSPAIVFVAVKPVNETVTWFQTAAKFFGLVTNPVGAIASVDLKVEGLDTEQNQVAKEIIEVGRSKGATDRDIKIALMVGMQESGMKNLNHGDDWYFEATGGGKSDSIGVFQQRDNGAWGTLECRTTVKCAAGSFYDELLKIDDRESMEEWQVAAAVQKPAKEYETHYQEWNGLADKIMSSATEVNKSVQPIATATPGKVFPISGMTYQTAEITSGYGERVHPISGVVKMHYGIDIAAETGTPIVSPENGTITEAIKVDSNGCGLSVGVTFADGNGVRFCHLSKVNVSEGQTVNAGDILGEVGSTGGSTGSHAHIERLEGGNSVDPTEYLESTTPPITASSSDATEDNSTEQPPVNSNSAIVLPNLIKNLLPNTGGLTPAVTKENNSIPSFFVSVQTSKGFCGGFAKEKDVIVTAEHCLESDQVTVVTQSGEWLKGIKIDSGNDVAYIKVEGANFTSATLGTSNIGDVVTSYGHPNGNKNIIPSSVVITRSSDVVYVAKWGEIPITPGYSGGCVLNSKGEVIGINRSIPENGDPEVVITIVK